MTKHQLIAAGSSQQKHAVPNFRPLHSYTIKMDTVPQQKKFDHFKKEKGDFLKREDQSKKGSIDGPIVEMVNELNQSDDLYTTSSCSGRVIITCQQEPTGVNDIKLHQKKGCKWIFTSHKRISAFEIMESLEKLKSEKSTDTATLRFEPFILHVCCRSLNSAKDLLETSITSGFRNSGISISRKDRIIVAIRSCPSYQVPLYFNDQISVSQGYIDFLVEKCNQMFDENEKRIFNLRTRLQTIIESS